MAEAPPKQQLVGSVLERRPTSAISPSFKSTVSSSGFPTVQHRSKSAFARTRDQKRPAQNRLPEAPTVFSSHVDHPSSSQKSQSDPDDWRRQVSGENQRRIEEMTEEQREQEKKEIFERFGNNVADILKKAREAKERKAQALSISTHPQTPNVAIGNPQPRGGISGSALKAGSHSQTSTPNISRPASRVRFADVTPSDVYVYESAPSSPRKKPLELLSPSDFDSQSSSIPVISLGEYQTSPLKRTASPESNVDPDLEEGTPEYIRRRFFPNQPVFDPSLAWIQSPQQPKDDPSSPSLRFDLGGKIIPASLHSTLPTHLGLHHHADGEHAGYTLDDLFLLSRSTVPAQRSSILGILARISRQLGRNSEGDYSNGILELKGQEHALRKRLVAVGVEALKERGSVGAMAVEVIWECLVQWDAETEFVEGVELKQPVKPEPVSATTDEEEPASRDLISSLPLEQFVLPHISEAFTSSTLPSESLSQLLSILHRLAQHTNEIANFIVTTPNLIANILRIFLLTPIPPTESSRVPDPDALSLLCTLVSASRANAIALADPADALLRFITPLPPFSPHPLALANSLLSRTLEFYTQLAHYGIYSHIATTASVQFSKLHQYVLSLECQSNSLRVAWLGLIEAWMVCATDPHRTTPSHEILWSQVTAWSWGPDVLASKAHLTIEDSGVWPAAWNCISSWLEGGVVNGVRAGEMERASVVELTKPGFNGGTEKEVVTAAFRGLKNALDKFNDGEDGDGGLQKLRTLARHAQVLAACLRLWLACTPPYQPGGNLLSPPFSLPFPQLADLSVKLVNHTLWAWVYSERAASYIHVFCRPLSLFLSYYLRLSRRLPNTSDGLWLAQAFVVICRLIPGDEEFSQRTLDEIIKLIDVKFVQSHDFIKPSDIEMFTEGGGMDVISPFLIDAFHPKDNETHLGPSYVSPLSISKATTQRLPPANLARGNEYPLPLPKDWIFTPLNHLLRSGTSSVFKSLPSSWDGSEVAMVRATMLLAKVMREVMLSNNLTNWMLSMAETAFGCMKVFMLEHEQHNEDSVEEVFRDGIVEDLMGGLLRPLALSGSSSRVRLSHTPMGEDENLEIVATRFLGHSTPFYQYYTDFVNLYDAISFGHPTFSQLLILPTSMRYPIDFRRYLWGDYGHALRNVRTKPSEILAETGDERATALSGYLWPIEKDPQMIGFFLRGLVKQNGLVEDGVARLIAIHHVASNIWEDLACGAEGHEAGKAGTLLKAFVDQAGLDVVRDVIRYKQITEDGEELVLPPQCYEGYDGELWASQRLGFIERVGGQDLKDRLCPLLQFK